MKGIGVLVFIVCWFNCIGGSSLRLSEFQTEEIHQPVSYLNLGNGLQPRKALNGKLQVLVPKDFSRMSAGEIENRYLLEGKRPTEVFTNVKGANKLADTPANRTLISKISNGKSLGVDVHGKNWFTGVDAASKSIYSYTRNGVVKGAGYMNMTPTEMIIKYGLK